MKRKFETNTLTKAAEDQEKESETGKAGKEGVGDMVQKRR